ncbi:hypothetical protein METY_2723 [Methylopila sp. Yamaguchi]|nr:hypothetical protein METY_2723 [Methylopila sp. Yamaguchi]
MRRRGHPSPGTGEDGRPQAGRVGCVDRLSSTPETPPDLDLPAEATLPTPDGARREKEDA